MADEETRPVASPVTGSGAAARTISGQFAAPAPALTPGTLLAGRYEILQCLGEGGMGAVYKARDTELDRVIALKVIRPNLAGNAVILARFKQELVLARQVTHRNVVRIYDLGEAEGVKFITMEHIEGEDLRSLLLKNGKFCVEESVEIAAQILSGLQAAHGEGVIHRDLKPGNIMRDQQGRIVVMDFGLARTMETSGLTETGIMLGTLEYMSPEQAEAKVLDARSDLYTVGLILYELLSGKQPFKADSALASLMKRAHEQAAPVSDVERAVPAGLAAAVARALEHDREKRFQTAQEFLDALAAFRANAPASTTIPLPSASEPRGKWIGVGVAVLLVIAAVAGWFVARRPRQPVAARAPVTVLVSDFDNGTSDSVFDGTLEPAFNLALEGASFITSYSRGQAHKLAAQVKPGTTVLDEASARLVAVREGINIIVTGSIAMDGARYRIRSKAEDAVSGKTISSREMEVRSKDEVLKAVGTLAAEVRNSLGDSTPESVQKIQAETFTSGSLEAAHEYALAQNAQLAGNWDEALTHADKALQQDPRLGRAYVTKAVTYYNTGQLQQAEKNFQLALANVDRMTDREKYRTRGAYYLMVRDTDKAIEQQTELVKQYPADTAGLANLALAYFFRRDMKDALEQGRKAVAIYPHNVAQRNNVGLYAMYAGDFDTAILEQRAVLEMNPAFVLAYVGTALPQLAQGHPGQAVETYQRLEKLSVQGASAGASGLADVALYQGHVTDAIKILEQGARQDLANNNPDGAATKFGVMANAYSLLGDNAGAIRAADRAVDNSKGMAAGVWAARAYVSADKIDKAMSIAQRLSAKLEPDPQAYAKLIEGETQLKRGKPQEAVKLFEESRKIADTWLGRFDSARGYIASGAFPEAGSDLDVCLKRRGEATAVFLDESPSYFLLPEVYYYLGRAQEGVKSPAAKESYKTFIALKSGGQDPLLADARKRANAQ